MAEGGREGDRKKEGRKGMKERKRGGWDNKKGETVTLLSADTLPHACTCIHAHTHAYMHAHAHTHRGIRSL